MRNPHHELPESTIPNLKGLNGSLTQSQENSKVSTANTRAAAEIRGLMAASRKTSKDLALALGISQSSASRRMNGQTILELNEVETIANWLEVPVMRIIAPQSPVAHAV